jgi:hypothetical protein
LFNNAQQQASQPKEGIVRPRSKRATHGHTHFSGIKRRARRHRSAASFGHAAMTPISKEAPSCSPNL